MKRWLARNGIGLAVVAVLLPATLGITFAQQWTSYLANWPTAPQEVAQTATGTYAGTEWTLESTERVAADSAEGRSIGLPNGSDLLIARIRVTPDLLDVDGKSPYCEVRLQELLGDDITREWASAAFSPIDYRTSDNAASMCTTELTAPYVFETPFVVPADAGSNGTRLGIALAVTTELPDYLRISLAP